MPRERALGLASLTFDGIGIIAAFTGYALWRHR
jgi:hypothetical protein